MRDKKTGVYISPTFDITSPVEIDFENDECGFNEKPPTREQEEIYRLKMQIEELQQVLKAFIYSTEDYMDCLNDRIADNAVRLNKHENSFHAMLITGRNTNGKNESNIS